MLANDSPEYPRFVAALSMLALLSPTDARSALEQRRTQLDAELYRITGSLADAAAMGLPRLFILEDDYRVALLRAQIAWLTAQLADLDSGALTWSAEWIAEIAARFEPPHA
ncbi:hypothetical protein [Subtercola endophyticus]|uniref:hypothetical protein n=1 Tax=Subtercola endophyticus TaxID=2895559 RepID=UPI001E3EDBA1|nr:hypothetical protein [Subtercola endophyticus]UFS57828.1 hypothetical protein LQ955_12350 [Subtercola endophyticus]